jgi:hypothetical protein
LSWFISSSYSKSEIARSPLTIAFAPMPREVDDSVAERLDLDVVQVAVACSMKRHALLDP